MLGWAISQMARKCMRTAGFFIDKGYFLENNPCIMGTGRLSSLVNDEVVDKAYFACTGCSTCHDEVTVIP